MTVAAPPRPPAFDDPEDLEALDALIEEARRRARRRRRRNGAVALLVVAAGLAALIGLGRGGPGRHTTASGTPTARLQVRRTAASGLVVVTMRGHVRASRTLHEVGGPAHYRVNATFRVVWRVPSSALQKGRTFRSASAVVIGTTSAIFDNSPARSCRGAIKVKRAPFVLRVAHSGYDPFAASITASDIGLIASPSPIATATSPTCARGLFAAHWRHAPGRYALVRRREWWVYNHPGFGFYGKDFTPLPKGGDSDGWIAGWGPAGSFAWLAVLSLHRTAPTAQTPLYQQVLAAKYTPLPGLFLDGMHPCINNQFAACRREDGVLQQAVEALVSALKRAAVPHGLERGDHELQHGLSALATAVATRIRLAHQATIGPFITADGSIITALNLMDKAAHDLNKEDPHLHLWPV